MDFGATILNTSDPKVPSPLNVEQYVANDTILEQAKTYLVILGGGGGQHDEPVAWTIIQRAESDTKDAEAQVKRLRELIEKKLK